MNARIVLRSYNWSHGQPTLDQKEDLQSLFRRTCSTPPPPLPRNPSSAPLASEGPGLASGVREEPHQLSPWRGGPGETSSGRWGIWGSAETQVPFQLPGLTATPTHPAGIQVDCKRPSTLQTGGYRHRQPGEAHTRPGEMHARRVGTERRTEGRTHRTEEQRKGGNKGRHGWWEWGNP